MRSITSLPRRVDDVEYDEFLDKCDEVHQQIFKSPMPRADKNSNCLEGYDCPKCGSLGSFEMTTRCLMRWTDDGTEEVSGDCEIDDEGFTTCRSCGHSGPTVDFRIDGR